MIREALLTPNEFSRPQLPMRRIDTIVLHWVGNPGTSAESNRRYFESLKDGSRKASSHYIIDKTEIVRCVPENEVAYHAGPGGMFQYTTWALQRWNKEHANWYCLGIEHCHPDWAGIWERDTIIQSHLLCAGLCREYQLDPLRDIVRHWDVTTSPCPRWFVNHPNRLTEFRQAVKLIMEA